MAIIKCPNCGKQISDRTQKCIFCNVVLIERQEQQKISVETAKTIAKENTIWCISVAIITFANNYISGLAFFYIFSRYLGNVQGEVIKYVTFNSWSNIIITLFMEILFFALFPLLCKRKPNKCVIGIILSIIWYSIYFFKNPEIKPQITDAEMFHSLQVYLHVGGWSILLVQSALSLLNPRKELKVIIVFVLILSGLYLILSVFLGGLAMTVFHWEIVAIGLAQLIAGVLVFIIAAVFSK